MSSSNSIKILIHEDGDVVITKEDGSDARVEPCNEEKFRVLMSNVTHGGKILYCCTGSPVCVYHSGKQYCG